MSWFSLRITPVSVRSCSSGGVKIGTPTSHGKLRPPAVIWKESQSISRTRASAPTRMPP